MRKIIANIIEPTALAITVGAMSNALANTALAETRDIHRLDALEEIVVTARRIEESMQDTPVAVTAFSNQDLESIGALQAIDVSRYTPNLLIRNQSGSGSHDSYAISIRGVGNAETALTIDPTVGLYQDGIYIARAAGAAFNIVDLERIEVLRGPQGALFGRNTIGGAVNIITKKPSGEWGTKLSAGFGDRGKYHYQVSLDTGAASLGGLGTLSAKLSFLRKVGEDGTRKSLYTGDGLGDYRSDAQRLALRWEVSDDLLVDYAYDRSRQDTNTETAQVAGVRDFQAALGGPYYAQLQAAASQDRIGTLPYLLSGKGNVSNVDGHALTIEYDVSPNFTVKSITSYREWHRKGKGSGFNDFPADGVSLIDLTGRYAAPLSPVPAGTLVPVFAADIKDDQRQFTQELQLIGGAFDNRFNYIAGLYYFHEQGEEFNPQQFVVPGPFIPGGLVPPGSAAVTAKRNFAYSIDNDAFAAYSQLSYKITDDLDISLGLRYTVDKRETTLTNTLDGVLKTVTDDDDWDNFNPSLTTNYNWTDDISTYATISTGYRSGGFNSRVTTESAFRDPFDEEKVTNYELGLKSDLLDRRLRLNLAVFHLIYEDRQITQSEAGSGGASSNVVNAGKSENTGFEIETVFIPVTGLRLIGNYGYTDVDYKEFITSPLSDVTGRATSVDNVDIAETANTNFGTPQTTASAAIEYEFDSWSFGALMLRLDATYTGSTRSHPQFKRYTRSDSYTLVNARAILSDIPVGGDGRLKLIAWGKNITNEKYRSFGIDFGALGFAIDSYGELATWGLDAVYEFNY